MPIFSTRKRIQKKSTHNQGVAGSSPAGPTETLQGISTWRVFYFPSLLRRLLLWVSVSPPGLEPPPQSSPRLKCSTGAFFNSGSRFKPSWAHTVNEPLTTNFCRWFFLCCQFGASFRQDFRLKFGRN